MLALGGKKTENPILRSPHWKHDGSTLNTGSRLIFSLVACGFLAAASRLFFYFVFISTDFLSLPGSDNKKEKLNFCETQVLHSFVLQSVAPPTETGQFVAARDGPGLCTMFFFSGDLAVACAMIHVWPDDGLCDILSFRHPPGPSVAAVPKRFQSAPSLMSSLSPDLPQVQESVTCLICVLAPFLQSISHSELMKEQQSDPSLRRLFEQGSLLLRTSQMSVWDIFRRVILL